MLNIRHRFLKAKGFLLIELLISISLTSIVILSLYSMLEYSITATVIGDSYDEILYNGRFVMEYIKDEINKADRIIAASKIENLNSTYPNNLGFVIMQDLDKYKMRSKVEQEAEGRYKFISYYFNGNEIQRIAYNTDSKKYPNASQLKGFNYLGENILSIMDSEVDFDNKLIYLGFSLGNEKKKLHNFKTTIYINCEIDY